MDDNNAWGKQVVEKALLYADHEWIPTEKNVMHGIDEYGRYVDTPDITWTGEKLRCGWWKPNEINKGVAYGWGNASSIEDFDRGIAEGKPAGNVPEDTSRYGSRYTVGVDCSGLVTVCWGLLEKITAKNIPDIADVIDINEIQQGDVLAKSSHVMIFNEFTDSEKEHIRIIDSTRNTGKVSQREFLTSDLLKQGYLVYRKRK